MISRQFFSPFNEINRSLNYKLNKNKQENRMIKLQSKTLYLMNIFKFRYCIIR
jgi:hypothetical protein